jgi:mRNA-degrading endonuclease YafQ of YafQ-DinJ toxin-antitoxin module
LKANPTKIIKYTKTIELLEQNPNHPSLRLHALKGKLKGYHSISIDMSDRIMLDLFFKDNLIILIDIGTHDLYK